MKYISFCICNSFYNIAASMVKYEKNANMVNLAHFSCINGHGVFNIILRYTKVYIFRKVK